jgi:hypothetical protein
MVVEVEWYDDFKRSVEWNGEMIRREAGIGMRHEFELE